MKKLGTSIVTLVLGLFSTGYFLTLFIKSYGRYNDGWGTTVSFDFNHLTKLIMAIIILIAGAYSLYLNVKGNDNDELVYTYSISLVGAISTFVPLGFALKLVTKWVQDGHTKYLKKVASEYHLFISDYLVWSAFGLIILAYGTVRYIAYKKNK